MSTSSKSDRHFLLVITAAALVGLLLWDATSLDLVLARTMGGVKGFPFRESFLLTQVLHDGARKLAWAVATVLSLAVWWPIGPLRRLSAQARVQLAVTALFAPLAVSTLKWFSVTSCPWDLSIFGGFARYSSHWSTLADGGRGHCFPAGHASAGFGFIGGYFSFRNVDSRVARKWLQAALVTGLVLGLAQQVRGAHFMSHTLWTAFICWCVAYALDGANRWWIPKAVPA